MRLKILAASLLAAGAMSAIAASRPVIKSGEAAPKPAPKAGQVTLTPETMKWGPPPAGLPVGAQAAALEGDPSKSGFFAVRLKMEAGYKIMPHWHPMTERITVIAGALYLGMGDHYDADRLTAYPAGSYIVMPKGMHHYALARGVTEVQLATMGPWGINYIDKAKDPRTLSSVKVPK